MSALSVVNGSGKARIVKVCTCCGNQFTETAWRMLRKVGIQDDGAGGRLELRDCCLCRSTIAIELPGSLPLITDKDRAFALDQAQRYLAQSDNRRWAKAQARRAKLADLGIAVLIAAGVVFFVFVAAEIARPFLVTP